MEAQGKLCKQAMYSLLIKTSEEKNNALKNIKASLLQNTTSILEANQKDIANAQANGRNAAFIDRLSLNEARIQAICDGIDEVIQLEDPCDQILETWYKDDLKLVKKRVPIGVIGIIYEARPNVSVDASILCLKSGNVCYLRGSKEALHTNKMLVHCMRKGLLKAGFDENCIALVEDTSREAALQFMRMNTYLDLLIPRGSANLIQTCVKNASVPLIETGSGNCIIYVDKDVNMQKAIDVIINAKCQRISVCNACESLLVHKDIVHEFIPLLLDAFKKFNVIVHGDTSICALDASIIKANEEDYYKEYLNYEISIKTVANVEEAIAHINTHHTMHSDAILSNNKEAIETFMKQVDSAVVYANASTRFSDGNEFGFGAEIGISTQKMHARGPMGLKALTTYKYQVYGEYSSRK